MPQSQTLLGTATAAPNQIPVRTQTDQTDQQAAPASALRTIVAAPDHRSTSFRLRNPFRNGVESSVQHQNGSIFVGFHPGRFAAIFGAQPNQITIQQRAEIHGILSRLVSAPGSTPITVIRFDASQARNTSLRLDIESIALLNQLAGHAPQGAISLDLRNIDLNDQETIVNLCRACRRNDQRHANPIVLTREIRFQTGSGIDGDPPAINGRNSRTVYLNDHQARELAEALENILGSDNIPADQKVYVRRIVNHVLLDFLTQEIYAEPLATERAQRIVAPLRDPHLHVPPNLVNALGAFVREQILVVLRREGDHDPYGVRQNEENDDASDFRGLEILPVRVQHGRELETLLNLVDNHIDKDYSIIYFDASNEFRQQAGIDAGGLTRQFWTQALEEQLPSLDIFVRNEDGLFDFKPIDNSQAAQDVVQRESLGAIIAKALHEFETGSYESFKLPLAKPVIRALAFFSKFVGDSERHGLISELLNSGQPHTLSADDLSETDKKDLLNLAKQLTLIRDDLETDDVLDYFVSTLFTHDNKDEALNYIIERAKAYIPEPRGFNCAARKLNSVASSELTLPVNVERINRVFTGVGLSDYLKDNIDKIQIDTYPGLTEEQSANLQQQAKAFFARFVKESNDNGIKLCRFITSGSTVGPRGLTFTIQRSTDKNRRFDSHTCINSLTIPSCTLDNYDDYKANLDRSIFEGGVSFEVA